MARDTRLSGGLLIALADTSYATKGRGKSRRGYYYNSPTTASERQLRNRRAQERGEYYETPRTLWPAVPAPGGTKKCARVPTNAHSIGAREQSAKTIVEGYPVRLEVCAPERFLMSALRELCQSFHPGIACNHFELGEVRPFFACGESHARRPDAADGDQRAQAMQFSAFFKCGSDAGPYTVRQPSICGEPPCGRPVTGEGPPPVQWLEPIAKRLRVRGRSRQRNRAKEFRHGQSDRDCEHPWNYQGNARG